MAERKKLTDGMRKKTDWKKTFYLMGLVGVISIFFTGCGSAEEEQKKFEEFLQSEFVTYMESDYTTAHIYLQNPEQYGIDMEQIDVGLGMRPTKEEMEKEKQSIQVSHDTLKKFDRNQLTDEQKDVYDSYDWQLKIEEQLMDDKFNYYESLFGSMTGIHYQIPTLLTDWEVRSEKDVQDLIIVVKDVKPYVDAALEYTKIQEEKGLLMLDLDSVIEYCESILEKGEDSSILQSMNETIDALDLEPGKADAYKKELKTAFIESVIPAYEEIKKVMIEFQSGTNNEEGLAAFEYGKEYFETILKQNVGSDKSVEDVRNMMEDELQQHVNNAAAIMMEEPSLIENINSQEFNLETGYHDYYEIMDDIKNQMFEDFPEVGQLNYVIEDINEEIASDSGVAAYFNIPTLDGESVKQLRVNPKTSDISTLSTFQTVAHEGFPGHMYQYAYMYENLETPFQKSILTSNAYAEGYATYAQYEANRYLSEIDPDLLDLYKENDLMNDCLIVLMDIGIHYDGWSEEELKEYINTFGFSMEEESLEEIYKQLQANPCAFEPYYVGYFEIENMKEEAQESLSEQFHNKKFNEAILKSGTAPFFVVERNVEAYINEAK